MQLGVEVCAVWWGETRVFNFSVPQIAREAEADAHEVVVCSGKELALDQSGYVVVRLLQVFGGFQGLGGRTGFVETVATTVGNRDGCWVCLKR